MADIQVLEKRPIPDLPVSLEGFLAWQEEDIHAEWVSGEVIVMSPSSRKHQEIAVFFTHIVGLFSQARNLGVVLNAPFSMRLNTTTSVREPDLLFIRTENLDRLKNTYLDGPADIAVEIVSPESIGRDRGDKFVEYEKAGISEYWLIDPVREQAEFYHLENEQYRLTELTNGIFHSAVLPQFWLSVDWLWQDPLPNPLDILRELKIL